MESSVVIWWLPAGAGGLVVRVTTAIWELLTALRERRRPTRVFHAAVEVNVDGVRYVIEQTPVPRATSALGPDRGVVQCGPVAFGRLSRFRLFRYEIRCWPDGVLPDRDLATVAPTRLAVINGDAHRVVTAASKVPALRWGRRPKGCAEMWNSNSVISWIFTNAGLDASAISPPGPGYAPGWTAGVAVAAGRPGPHGDRLCDDQQAQPGLPRA